MKVQKDNTISTLYHTLKTQLTPKREQLTRGGKERGKGEVHETKGVVRKKRIMGIIGVIVQWQIM